MTRRHDGSRSLPPLLMAAALLALAGCNGASFNKLFSTEHFDYYVEEGVTPPCDGTDRWLERYYDANAKFLGVTLPPGMKIEYYLAGSEDTLQQAGCPPGTSCAGGGSVYSRAPLHSHEIVHASAFFLGSPPPLFVEGLAVVLGCQATDDTGGRLDLSDPIELLIEGEAFNDYRETSGFSVYNASASFVRYLIDKHGSSRFASLYAQAQYRGSREETADVFQMVMGESLDDALADWRTKPAPHYGDLCLRRMECDPSMPELTDSEVALGCGPSRGFGPSNQDALLRFEVPEDRMLHITTDAVPTEPQGFAGVNFYRCHGGDVMGSFVPTSGSGVDADRRPIIAPEWPGSVFALDVPPGQYVAWLWGSENPRVRVDVEERGSPMTSGCQVAEDPLVVEHERLTFLSSRFIDRPCQGPWCPGQSFDVVVGPTGGYLQAFATATDDGVTPSPAELYVCSYPCPEDASHCEVLDLDPASLSYDRTAGAFPPGTLLHLGAPAAPFEGHFTVALRLITPE